MAESGLPSERQVNWVGMRFTFRQLEYFIAAGETGSITLASERVHISQPSISTAISNLEQVLGAQLFVRHHAQGLSLTPAGRVLLVEAKFLIQQAENLYAVTSNLNEKVRGQLSLGCFVTIAPMVMPELSHSFTTVFPATRIRHQVGDQEQLLESLRRAEIDLALTYDLLVPEGFTFVSLASLPPHVLVSEGHPFAGKNEIGLEKLISEPFILLDLPFSREYFLSLFAEAGLEPLIAQRSAHQDVIRTMVANGHGYTLANVRPRLNAAMDGRPLKCVKLSGTHRPMVLGLIYYAQLRKSRLTEAFESHCRSLVTESYIPGMAAFSA